MRIRLDIEYDGTSYCGWQRQKNGTSIQEMIEHALQRVTGEQARVTGSGRTDAGVHALCQTAHFDTNAALAPERFAFALNYYLPADVRILSSRAVPDTFHARFGAKDKTYRYVFRNDPQRSAIFRDLSAHELHPLSLEAMRRAAAFLVGEHDFASFCTKSASEKSTVRTIHSIEFRTAGPYIQMDITGTGFLHNMVRIIAGTLACVGRGDLSPDAVGDILEAKDRTAAGPTAPARGLFLVGVRYGAADAAEASDPVRTERGAAPAQAGRE